MPTSFHLRAPIVVALIASALAVAAVDAAEPDQAGEQVGQAGGQGAADQDRLRRSGRAAGASEGGRRLVVYGAYDCEFQQSVNIAQSSKYPAYVDVKFGKSDWLMKPVLSSTGAIRLEDIRGETLMVQIASKSMLLNVKTAHRIVDDCISPKQRELIAEAKAAKAAGEAAAGRLIA